VAIDVRYGWLDFGGGVGLAYVQVLSSLRGNHAISYHVVELEKMCAAGRRLFADDPRIQFHTFLPALRDKLDIVYASGLLPYIDDYAGLVRQLAGLNASYIMLTHVAAGRFRTYARKTAESLWPDFALLVSQSR